MIGLWLFYSQGSCPSFLINKLAATFQKNLRKYCKMKTILLDKAQQSEQNVLGFLKLCEFWRLYSWLYVFELSVWPVHLLYVSVFNTGASDQCFYICSFHFNPCPWFSLPLFTLFTNWDNTRSSCLNAQGCKNWDSVAVGQLPFRYISQRSHQHLRKRKIISNTISCFLWNRARKVQKHKQLKMLIEKDSFVSHFRDLQFSWFHATNSQSYFKLKPITTLLMCHRNILALLQLRGRDARNGSGAGEANTACGAWMFSPRAVFT